MMPFEVGKTRAEEVSLENEEFDFGQCKCERLAEGCQEAVWNGKAGSLCSTEVLTLWSHWEDGPRQGRVSGGGELGWGRSSGNNGREQVPADHGRKCHPAHRLMPLTQSVFCL